MEPRKIVIELYDLATGKLVDREIGHTEESARERIEKGWKRVYNIRVVDLEKEKLV